MMESRITMANRSNSLESLRTPRKRTTAAARLDRAIDFLRQQLRRDETPPEQRKYALLAIDLVEGNVGAMPGERRAAKAWILSNIKLPRRQGSMWFDRYGKRRPNPI
jgi:hypothetical protein